MRNRREVTTADLAPAAQIGPAKFQKVDWPVVFVVPFDVENLSLILIDLHDRTRPDEGRHTIVAHAYEAVGSVSQIHLLNQSDGDLVPDIDQLREKSRLVQP